MKHDDIRKLLGGYATGTLTEEERRVLYEAALEDQQLFDALADEEALKQLLADPAYRRELAAELAAGEPTLGEKIAAWWRRPLPLALAGAVAALAVVAVVLYPRFQTEAPVEIAQVRPAAEERALEMRQEPAEKKAPAPLAASADKKLKSELADIAQPEPAAPAEELEGGGMPRKKAAEALPSQPRRKAARRADALAERMGAAGAPAPARAKAVMAYREEGRAMEAEVQTAAMPAAKSRQGLACLVEQRAGDGTFRPVPPSDTVDRRAFLRLSVRVPSAGIIYVFETGPEGAHHLIQTTPIASPGWIPVPETEPLAPPSGPGERHLTVLFSKQPLLIPPSGEPSAADMPTRQMTSLTIRYR